MTVAEAKAAVLPLLQKGDFAEASRRLNAAGIPVSRASVEFFAKDKIKGGKYATQIMEVLTQIAEERAKAYRASTQRIKSITL